MDAIIVSRRVSIPADALAFRAVRSAGPGGQNVNKLATKVELRVDLDRILGLSRTQRHRLEQRACRRLDSEGRLVVTSQRTRSQAKNLEDARQKLRSLVAEALAAPKRRIPTRPSRGARERRLEQKRSQAEKKRRRRWEPE